ncbi:hypothetical protein [Acinetobacter baumannii]|uniref:hypothetical protein n=1 Tax=Acinetobacter baumannii TaxID=470 RepID=UPI000871B81C|nr:hypothetical protein [Acinetobacter baumannii]OFD28054.1 hypothetical protein A1D05_00050 [Acinetobacter baumannii]OFD28763.1 hypothetical protein A1D07_00045 [Acinetobacter baumannii]OFD33934.1 hypothetical protein A1D08_00045 [Acinetobacter baumannii]POZ07405.1 hypothetical protein C3415_12210 [Acinetobacter baumannii]TPU54236.1 hypothetical protein FJV29_15010 [Acinetobacter baumannii]
MNAKINIQLPGQSVPFYNATNLLNAYKLAYETATQLRTLLNQISKSAIFVKTYAEENNLDNSIFTEIENLIAISLQLSNSHTDIYNAEIKRHRQEPYDQYDADDLNGAYALAHENTTWLETLISKIRIEVNLVKEAVKGVIHGAVFATLEHLINIAEYLAETNVNAFSIESEKYEAQWEASKNG